MQEPNRQNQLEKKKFIAYFHLFAIFTLSSLENIAIKGET